MIMIYGIVMRYDNMVLYKHNLCVLQDRSICGYFSLPSDVDAKLVRPQLDTAPP
jgi:hypothetical protein